MQRWKANSDIGSFVERSGRVRSGELYDPAAGPATRPPRSALAFRADFGENVTVRARGLAMPDPDFPTTWADGFDPPGAPPAPSETVDDAVRTPPPSGQPGVPGYELIQELGRGGTAVVYLARQVALDRRVALKMVLAGGFASDADRQRFRAEAAAVAAVQHPGIVHVYQVGACGDRPYFALEYCPGGSLAQTLADGPLPPRESATVIGQVARAVQAAHARGIVHRDLKPGNILFTADGAPKVTDFGLARRSDRDTDTALTRTGAVMGTPSYMAPEQARGSRAVGPAADVYALGAVLYECLTGRPPFLAATALDTVLHAVHDDPVAPARLQPKVPRDLETVCLTCLQKDPAKRYPSAAALADDLDRFLDGRPIQARPVPAWERAWKAARRRPAVAVGLAVSALSLVLVVAVVLVANARLQRERDDADAAHRSADARRREALAAKEALERQRQMAYARIRQAAEAVERMMSRVTAEPWATHPDLQDERRKVLEDAVAFFKYFVWEDSPDPVVRREAATAYMRVASAYLALGKYRECQDAVEAAARLRKGLATEFPQDADHARGWAESVGFLGRLAAVFGEYDTAYRHYYSAVGLAQLALKLDPAADESKLVLAESYSALGQYYEGTDHAKAVENHAHALRIGEELAARPNAPYRHRLTRATTLVHLGVLDLSQRLESGYVLLEQARPLVRALDREAAPTARAQEQFALTRAALYLYRGDYLVRAGKREK
ncbi:MAG TPA: serine/threonine-protein kinase, partial [Fimbriiglobus sp.]|nr:serine/threonine-protein kinase [Fimbriiglobus sp.]